MNVPIKIGPIRVRPQVLSGSRTGKWCMDVPPTVSSNNLRCRRLFDNRRKAIDEAQELLRQALGGPNPVSSDGPAGLTFSEAAERWAEDEKLRVATRKKRASTLEVDLHRLKALKGHLGELDVAEITKRDLLAYQQARLEQGLSPATVNSDLGTFGLVMRWAADEGYISERPRVEQIPLEHSRPVIPTPEEAVRIISFLPTKQRLAVWMMAETGCRKGEVLNLTWDAVDLEDGSIEIRSRSGWTPKTRSSERTVHLSPDLTAALKAMPRKGTYVFSGNKSGRPLTNIRRSFASAVKKAKITRRSKPVRITPHSLRRAYATWLAENGVPESLLQSLMGHAPGSRVTKRYYVRHGEEAKRQAVISLPFAEQAGNEKPEKVAISGNRRAERPAGVTANVPATP